jgi:hypothetical protein
LNILSTFEGVEKNLGTFRAVNAVVKRIGAGGPRTQQRTKKA